MKIFSVKLWKYLRRIFKRREGVTLLVAILFISAFLFVIAGLYEVQVRVSKNRSDVRYVSIADQLVRSIMELATQWVEQNGVGANVVADTYGNSIVPPDTYLYQAQYMANRMIGYFCNILRSGTGYSCGSQVVGFSCFDVESRPGRQPCVNFEVRGRSSPGQFVSMNGGACGGGGTCQFASVPIAGSGDAGVGSGAGFSSGGATSITSGTGGSACDPTSLSADDLRANAPCNWDRLYVGQSVEIPLYYMDGVVERRWGLDSVCSGASCAADLNARLMLRVRPPLRADAPAECLSNGALADDVARCPRETLFPQPTDVANYGHIKKDPVLIQWTITGTATDAMGREVSRTLVARDGVDEGDQNKRDFKNLVENSTEISGGRIVNADSSTMSSYAGETSLDEYIVLAQDYSGTPISSDLLGPSSQIIEEFIRSVSRPVLRLTMVAMPRKDLVDGDNYTPTEDENKFRFNVPSLEWQLLTDTAHPVASHETVIIGKSQIKDFRKKGVKIIPRKPSFGGFALEQF